jgi:Domain of unknown function (DUF4345)
MAMRVFLALEALVWLPYGIFCFFDPGFLAGAAGVAFQTPTGSTELRAMYGGLQVALGGLALSGAARAEMTRPALVTIAWLTAGLGTARLFGAALDGGLSGYTIFALLFELGSASVARWLLRPDARPD